MENNQTLEQIKEREQKLIDQYFSWGKDGHPTKASLKSPEQRRAYVEDWLAKQALPYQTSAAALIARLQDVLTKLRSELPRHEAGRFTYRIDEENQTKSPGSILEKMARQWTDKHPEISFGNLTDLTDLGRLRIVSNFLSDALLLKERLVQISIDGDRQDEPGKNLAAEFHLERNHFDDSINKPPEKRTKGERCYKGTYRLREEPQIQIEVQIATILQEAWDKKDHYLIYEKRRVGITPDQEHEILMYSMSELLYIADDTFDRLKREIDKKQEDKDEK